MDDPLVGEEFLAAVATYTRVVEQAVNEAAASASARVQESMRSAALQSTRWADIADQVQVYSQDGRYWVGVDSAAVSEAMTAEYGDEHHPPVPLFRGNNVALNRLAEDTMDAHLLPIVGMGVH